MRKNVSCFMTTSSMWFVPEHRNISLEIPTWKHFPWNSVIEECRQLWNSTRFCTSKSTILCLLAPADFMHLLLDLQSDRRYQGTRNQQHGKREWGRFARCPSVQTLNIIWVLMETNYSKCGLMCREQFLNPFFLILLLFFFLIKCIGEVC